jgi:hypothetical protein
MNFASNTALVASTTPSSVRGHPADDRMPDPGLDVLEDLPSCALVAAPIEGLGSHPKLDEEVIGVVWRLRLTALFPPQTHKRSLVRAHDDPGVRAADK